MPHKKQAQSLDEIRELIQERYPELLAAQENGECIIRGRFPVRADRVVVDQYLVEILIPKNFPIESPLVKEIGGRIKQHADRHVYKGGYCCLFLPLERWKYLPESATILTFLDGPLNDYLFGQTYFEEYGCWPFGERGHGKVGITEYLSEELGTTDVSIATRFLLCLRSRSPKGHWPCFCGSGKKMRNCHFNNIIKLHGKMNTNEIDQALQILSEKN